MERKKMCIWLFLNTTAGGQPEQSQKLQYTKMRTPYYHPYNRTLALCNSVYGFEMSWL